MVKFQSKFVNSFVSVIQIYFFFSFLPSLLTTELFLLIHDNKDTDDIYYPSLKNPLQFGTIANILPILWFATLPTIILISTV